MSLSPADKAFEDKYGKAPVKAKAQAQAPTRAELEELRQFKTQEQKRQAAQANKAQANKTTPPPVANRDNYANALANALANAKATHEAVQLLRVSAGAQAISFDMAAFEATYTRLNTKAVKISADARAKHLQTAMQEQAKKQGQALSADTYKTPKQIAAQAAARTPQQQSVAMRQAILAEFKKL